MQNHTTSSRRSRAEITQQECPACAAMIPVNFGYATWCECGWNLQPYEPSPPSTPSEKLYAKVGDVMGERLFQSIMRSDPLASGFTFTRLLAYAIAAVVHGVTLLF